MSSQAAIAAVVFAGTYLVIGLQGLPRLRIGRPAGALLGAVAMVACGVLDFGAAKAAIDLDTILFLLGMMIVLGYLELSGFFEVVERWILGRAGSARGLLWLVVGSSGVLSALFMNDTVCLMLTPIVVRVTRRLELPVAPYLIALATAANIGSTATIIGNPQNALIAVRSGIGFLPFLGALAVPAAVGLLIDGAILTAIYRRSISAEPLVVPPPREQAHPAMPTLVTSLACGCGLVVALMLGAHPATAAVGAGAVMILIGPARSKAALQQVDWGLLLFFGGLFVVMRGVEVAGLAGILVHQVSGPLDTGLSSVVLGRLAVAVTLLSQAVSNVPAVMLFLPSMQAVPAAAAEPLWMALAAFATLAGNLTIIGSAANVIVFESAKRDGVEVGFLEYLRVGLPVTVLTLIVAVGWLLIR
ncbi:MAG TPA: SLC13 family permease [Candidatus Polarisedimenticolia bacterium]|nr:SLC13 family permease [Candidatus Polarisedimenticolia bacterium]